MYSSKGAGRIRARTGLSSATTACVTEAWARVVVVEEGHRFLFMSVLYLPIREEWTFTFHEGQGLSWGGWCPCDRLLSIKVVGPSCRTTWKGSDQIEAILLHRWGRLMWWEMPVKPVLCFCLLYSALAFGSGIASAVWNMHPWTRCALMPFFSFLLKFSTPPLACWLS